MGNRIWIYLGIVGFVLLLVGSYFMGLKSINGKIAGETESEQNFELGRYRSEDIPLDCQLPEYENSVESWKEHLSHHKETLYCLDYFK